jgi:hypothetical protein
MRAIVVLGVAAVLGAGAMPAAAALLADPTPRIGTDGADTLTGSAQEDALFGLAGDDRLDGGAGNDDLDGGPGADDLRGGAGSDAASYLDATGPVTVTLDDRAGDGAPGEGDNVHADVESVYGGVGDDTLTGGRAANTLDGGAGADTLTGGAGSDGLYGGPGDDVIDARDGEEDKVDCGEGADRYRADAVDDVSGCESAVTTPGAGTVAIPVRSFFGVPAGVSVRRACRPGIRLELRLGGRVLARANVRLTPAGRRCEFSKTFRVARASIGRATQLQCRIRYAGTTGFGGDRWSITVAVP